MHAIVNNRAAGYVLLRKLQRVREIEKNVGLWNNTVLVWWVKGSGVGSEGIKESALTSRKPLTWLL